MLAGELGAEAVDVVVVAPHRDEVAAVHAGGEHLLLLEIERDEHVRLHPGRRGMGRDRVGEVAGRGAGDGLEAELTGAGQRDRDDAILERMRGIGRVVLDPYLPQAELLGQPVGLQQRRPAGGQDPARGGLHRQEVGVAPQRVRPRLDPAAQLSRIRRRARQVRDFERAEALLADVPRLERVGCLAFLATKRLWRHMKKPPPGSVVGSEVLETALSTSPRLVVGA